MKKILILLLTALPIGLINAQISFDELDPGPTFVDARNGSIAEGDVDNDGDIDVVITGKDGNQLKSTLYTNDGIGNFTMVSGTPFVSLQFGNSEFADIDNDGDLDILITGSNFQPQSFANLYSNDGSGNFSLVSDTPFQVSTEGDVAFEDIDNDNDLDLMMVGYDPQGNGFTKLYQNDGSGEFTELTTSTFEPAKSGSIAFFDYDNDGDNDVIVSGENNNGSILTTLYTNNGSGIFTIVSNTPFIGVMSGDIDIADTDNDGDLDVLLNGSGPSNTTNIYLNDGSGGFDILTNTNFPQTSLGDAAFADFDNDGDMDILVTGAIIGVQFASDIFENTGSNNFVFAGILNPMYLTSTAIADFDGDSDLDIIMVGINNTPTAFKTRMFLNLNALSVSLVFVEAKTIHNKSIRLSWQTASEENNEYFSIEHSTDGVSFREIAQQNGYGTTSTAQNYSYVHDNLENRWHYYRLKQIDFDGKYEYSNIVNARIYNDQDDILLMPNPTTGIISIQTKTLLEKSADLQILNPQGQVVLTTTLHNGQQQQQLDISTLPNGTYYFKLLKGNGLIVKKIIKQ
jgi:hypothetical protein